MKLLLDMMQKAVLKHVDTLIVVTALVISGYFGCQKKGKQLGNLWTVPLASTVPGCIYHRNIV